MNVRRAGPEDLSTGRDNREAQALDEKLGWVRDTEYYHYELPLFP